MADDDRCRAPFADERAEQLVDDASGRGVQLTRRLVGDQQRRPVHERGAECDPLLLATRELLGPCAQLVTEPDPLEQGARARES